MWRTFDIQPTPEEMALEFWAWESDKQARFLNGLSLQWNRLGWRGDGQLPFIADENITEITKNFIDALHQFLVREQKGETK